MKPIDSVLTGVGSLFLLSILFSLLCAFMPDIYLYDLYISKFGFLTETEWYDRYITALMILSLLFTSLLVWLLSHFWKRIKTG